MEEEVEVSEEEEGVVVSEVSGKKKTWSNWISRKQEVGERKIVYENQ